MTENHLSLYVHIPFCTVKCSYCDFNSYANLEHLMRPYVDALVAEIGLWTEQARDYSVHTIFFGGGTPSLLPVAELARILQAIRGGFTMESGCEISLEANPGTVQEEFFQRLLELGVNRLSMGVQSFHDDELAALDRLHNAEQAREAYRRARRAGFQRINLDLIYGLPGQSLERWRGNLEEAVSLGPDHLSLYALTVEEGTPLAHRVAQGRAPVPDDDLQAEMYEWTSERMSRAGYEHYEISNWALAGQYCQHNLTYWESRPYLGFGAGAHSFFEGVRFANVYSPQRYIQKMASNGDIAPGQDGLPALVRQLPHIASVEELGPRETVADALILGLRLREGVRLRAFRERFGVNPLVFCKQAIEELEQHGLLEWDEERLRLTDRGLLLANEVFVRLLPD
ncbi:MAG TPA: radical SAM family heme chaperone HemW [Dehalococcoidia bacterium]|nr:radical SAM family heme chaperone HemW [Dehalococcoidia bacterium]